MVEDATKVRMHRKNIAQEAVAGERNFERNFS